MLTEQDHLINSLSDHIQANAECLKRLAMIVSIALPHTENDVNGLLIEWHQINSEINSEYKAAIKEMK